jgi:hypothetical protein
MWLTAAKVQIRTEILEKNGLHNTHQNDIQHNQLKGDTQRQRHSAYGFSS